MTLAQHHGLPTRLLDWTYSPFVAMHYATNQTDRYRVDGVIWEIDFVEANRLLPDPLKSELSAANAHALTIGMLERALPDVRCFDTLSADPLVAFFEPPSIDARIVNQFALFSFMSGPCASLDNWLALHPGLFRRIIIPGISNGRFETSSTRPISPNGCSSRAWTAWPPGSKDTISRDRDRFASGG